MIALCHTSNPGSAELQALDCGGDPLYVRVARMVADGGRSSATAASWSAPRTPSELAVVREIVGDLPILVPGVGAQGGDAAAAVRAGADARRPGPARQQLAVDPLRLVAATTSPTPRGPPRSRPAPRSPGDPKTDSFRHRFPLTCGRFR